MLPGSSRLPFVKAMALLLCSIAIVPESRPATYGTPKKTQTRKKKDPKDQKGEQTENAETGKRQPPPQAKPAPVARLNLKYRIFKRAGDGHVEETNPDATFMQDDRVQLRVKPSRAGYLYIIQSEGDKDGELIFPHSGIGGQNLLTNVREEFVIPATDCDKKYKDDQGVCWLPIRSATGRVWITVYFAASPTDRPFTIQSGGKVSHEEILNIRNAAATAEPSGNYGRQVTAARNAKAVAARIELNHESAVIDAAASAKHDGPSNPTNPSVPANSVTTGSGNPSPLIKPVPSAVWGKAEVEFDGLQANGLRVTLLKMTEAGRVPASPLDSFRAGDRLNLDFYINFDGYVYALDVSPNGTTTVVYPDGPGSKKIKAGYRSLAAMKRLELRVNEKGVHTLQVVLAANRVAALEEALEKRSGQLNPVSGATQQSRDLGFDCASPLNLFQATRRNVSVANDASCSQAGVLAIVLTGQVAAQPAAGPDPCRNLTAEQIKGDKLRGQEVAIFEIRFKQV